MVCLPGPRITHESDGLFARPRIIHGSDGLSAGLGSFTSMMVCLHGLGSPTSLMVCFPGPRITHESDGLFPRFSDHSRVWWSVSPGPGSLTSLMVSFPGLGSLTSLTVCFPGPRIKHGSDGLFYLLPYISLSPTDGIEMCANLGFRLFRANSSTTMNVARNISSKGNG